MDAQLPPKPTFSPFNGLPALPALALLQARRQWVVWDYRLNKTKTKWTKPPLKAADGTHASHGDPSTWSSYEAAERRAMRDGLPGVGFVLTDEDGIGGFDLDNCRDAASGTLAPWAAEILAFGETYAEVSPSGRGVRIFCEGKPEKAAKCDPAGVEVYRKERFLTTTGRHIAGTPTEIRPAPRTLAALLARVDATLAAIAAEKARIHEAAAAQAAGERVDLGGQFRQGQQRQGGRIWEATHPRDPFWKNVNDAAFGSLDAWVPALFDTGAVKSSKGYRVSSAALRRTLDEDLSITSAGAKDFGVHDQGDAKGGARTAIDLVVEWGNAPDASAAALWLCDRLGRDPASLEAVMNWRQVEPRFSA